MGHTPINACYMPNALILPSQTVTGDDRRKKKGLVREAVQ